MLKQSTYNTVSKNNITGGYGVTVDQGSINSVSENNVSGSPYGIMLVNYASYNTVSKNNVNGSVWIGLRLYDHAGSNDVLDNNVTNSGTGVDLDRQCASNAIIGNDIAFNAIGISIDDSPDNRIYHNRIRNNTEQVYTDNTANVWDNGFPSGGNFWSDYEARYPNARDRCFRLGGHAVLHRFARPRQLPDYSRVLFIRRCANVCCGSTARSHSL
jgi:parallel beta-helix repeat protein